jgi:hypothetical protein
MRSVTDEDRSFWHKALDRFDEELTTLVLRVANALVHHSSRVDRCTGEAHKAPAIEVQSSVREVVDPRPL